MKTLLFTLAASISFNSLIAQEEEKTPNPLTISGYVEVYYNYDFNRPVNNTAPGFLYNFNRTGEVNLNLGYIKANYKNERVRANLALAAGSYMNANYAAEAGILKNVFEANVGVKLAKNANLWLDAGIMPSHIGFESAVGRDNWALTRSLVAENTPYFESGVKLGYTTEDGKLYLAAMYLNGWQRIQRVDGNSSPAFGTQFTYKPSESVTLNYSTFIGNDKPDSVRQTRIYHNFYGIMQLSEKWGLTAGFDYGMEQKAKGSRQYNNWFVPVMIVRYTASPKLSFAARGEYFSDEKEVIITTGSNNGFRTTGVSVNMDYALFDKVLWRLEVRRLSSNDALFAKKTNEGFGRNNLFATTSLSIVF
ncbi:porin [Dyadobacter luteus]|uniref:Porin n=1 Tax=Dyadobacter luteus TaxID=2259619 RepID=A0A3D8Y672_9BACT|nr:porin [Dyadobacter luteus]REA57435.1 porin [Dyadobacter luteus]